MDGERSSPFRRWAPGWPAGRLGRQGGDTRRTHSQAPAAAGAELPAAPPLPKPLREPPAEVPPARNAPAAAPCAAQGAPSRSASPGAAAAKVKPLKRLAALAHDCAQRLLVCLGTFQAVHTTLVDGIQEFLVADPAGIDEHAICLVEFCAAFFRDCERLLGGEQLRIVCERCEQILHDCTSLEGLIRDGDSAESALGHYEAKVSALQDRQGSARRFFPDVGRRGDMQELEEEGSDSEDGAADVWAAGGRISDGEREERGEEESAAGSGGPAAADAGAAAPQAPAAGSPAGQRSGPAAPGGWRSQRSAPAALQGCRSEPLLGPHAGGRAPGRAPDPGPGEPGEPGEPSVSAPRRALQTLLPSADRLARNQRKLAQARAAAAATRGARDVELQAFADRRATHSRAVVHSLLEAHVRLLADWGRRAGALAGSFDEELRPGREVQVVGVGGDGAEPLCAVLEEAQAATARWVVATPDGARFAVRPENLRPTPGAGDAVERLRLEPDIAPCGVAAEVALRCLGLDGPIEEVLVDGAPAEVLEASGGRARVRLRARAAAGPARVEVRAAGWRQRLAAADAGLRWYWPVGFGARGRNVELSQADSARVAGGGPRAAPPAAPPAAPTVAVRSAGLLDGVALTAEPLVPLADWCAADGDGRGGSGPGGASGGACAPEAAGGAAPGTAGDRGASGPCGAARYFEVEVQELARRCTGTTRTLAVGVVWRRRPAAGAPAPPEAALPEVAHQLPRSFVIGGDLPRVFLGGKEVRKVAGWRPLLELRAGTAVGVLLEPLPARPAPPGPGGPGGPGGGPAGAAAPGARGPGDRGAAAAPGPATHRLSIFQDGVKRCSAEGAVPPEWEEEGDVFGAVDVCGTVQRVALRQAAEPPAAPPAAPAAEPPAGPPGAGAGAAGRSRAARAPPPEAAPPPAAPRRG